MKCQENFPSRLAVLQHMERLQHFALPEDKTVWDQPQWVSSAFILLLNALGSFDEWMVRILIFFVFKVLFPNVWKRLTAVQFGRWWGRGRESRRRSCDINDNQRNIKSNERNLYEDIRFEGSWLLDFNQKLTTFQVEKRLDSLNFPGIDFGTMLSVCYVNYYELLEPWWIVRTFINKWRGVRVEMYTGNTAQEGQVEMTQK